MKQISKWDKFGFTTGMAAAAAAAAASELIIGERRLGEIALKTPDGRRELIIEISSVQERGDGTTATVIKRAGPDRDITNGLLIEVDVVPTSLGYVCVEGGLGVGRVTRPGLAAPVDTAAINPVPLSHIKGIVAAKIPNGARVTVHAPDGSRLAAKTFNPRLGVVGGISILGTTGIVRPMSLSSWKAALLPQLDQATALGHKMVALTPGNLGAVAAGAIGIPEGAVAQMGNFAGFMIRAAAKRSLDILLIGHLGKVVKIACGYENTHHQKTPDRLRLLAGLVKELKPELAPAVAGQASAESTALYLLENAPEVLSQIAKRAFFNVKEIAPKNCVGVMITDLRGRVVGSYPKMSELTAGIS